MCDPKEITCPHRHFVTSGQPTQNLIQRSPPQNSRPRWATYWFLGPLWNPGLGCTTKFKATGMQMCIGRLRLLAFSMMAAVYGAGNAIWQSEVANTWGLIFTVAFHTNDFARIVTITAPALAYSCKVRDLSLLFQQLEFVCPLSALQRPTGDVHGLCIGSRFEGFDQNSEHTHHS